MICYLTNLLFLVVVILITFNSSLYFTNAYKSKTITQKCNLCNDLIDNFVKGLKKTENGNFGGGNTDWEDRKLGSYLLSETRFEEIIEHICKETDCHQLLEEQEDVLLDWFKTKQKQIESDLKSHICVDKVKFCCPSQTYGPKCLKCPLNFDLICSGNGNCDGESTRDGTGKCNCNSGYSGDLCNECNLGYYQESKNDTFIKCLECPRSCSKCSGPNENECDECKNGWIMNQETKLCEDINECLVKENVCKEREFCENTDGSYNCYECNPACLQCNGKSSNNCIGECNHGYKKQNLNCIDINECEETPQVCAENLQCINKPGSYECKIIDQDDNNDNDNDDDEKSDQTNNKDRSDL